MTPRWTILIVSVLQRRHLLDRMLAALSAQAAAHDGAVDVLVYVDNFDRPRHEARNLLVARAKADYVSFVDDDDRVPDHFVARVLAALSADPDYVGWRMQCTWAGEVLKPTFHSLRYDTWHDDDDGFYRHVSHLNPIRRRIAAAVKFPPVEFEDFEWAQAVHRTGLARREVFIEDVMYEYLYDPDKSLVHGANRQVVIPGEPLLARPWVTVLGPADVDVVAPVAGPVDLTPEVVA